MFDPQPSDDLKRHFKTYLEMISCSPDDLPIYMPQQMSDIGRCSICKNWHFTSTTEIQRHKRLLHLKVQLQKLLKVNPGSEVPNLLYVGTKLTTKSMIYCFLHTTNYIDIKKSQGTNQRGQGRPKMIEINAIRKRKRFLPKKRVSKTFFKRKQINVKYYISVIMKLRKTLMKHRKTLRKRINNHPMKKARTNLVRCQIATLTRWQNQKKLELDCLR